MNVRQNTTGSDRDALHHLVQLFVVADRELDVSGNNSASFVVLGGISGQFENFRAQVLENRSQVDRSSATDAFGVSSLSEKSRNTTDRERETSAG